MKALALDLGTTTGYALHREGEPIIAGSWLLASSAVVTFNKKNRVDRRNDPRVWHLFDIVRREIKTQKLDWIFFEDVQFGKTLGQVQLWSSLRAAVWIAAMENNVPVECCPVGTLKKSGSGSGAAKKEGMAYALTKTSARFKLEGSKVRDTFTHQILDDNAVDAIHLLNWGLILTRNWKPC